MQIRVRLIYSFCIFNLVIFCDVQNAAVEALKHFVPAYLLNAEDKTINDFVSKYLEQLRDSNVAARRGSALAIGVLPLKFLATRWKVVLPKLCIACAIEVSLWKIFGSSTLEIPSYELLK